MAERGSVQETLQIVIIFAISFSGTEITHLTFKTYNFFFFLSARSRCLIKVVSMP